MTEGRAAQPLQLLLESPCSSGRGQTTDPVLGRGEGHPMAAAGGVDAQGDGQMRLAGARRAYEDHVLGLVQEVDVP